MRGPAGGSIGPVRVNPDRTHAIGLALPAGDVFAIAGASVTPGPGIACNSIMLDHLRGRVYDISCVYGGKAA
jgi:hypothetical protein